MRQGGEGVELDERKRFILQVIIEDYIQTASPVGSRTISKREDVSFSSATIRNEMSDLEEMGYLMQPHASAGRVPSAKAYRLYVDQLIEEDGAGMEEVDHVRQLIARKLDGAEDIISQTAGILAEITQYPSLVLAPSWDRMAVKRIQLVPVSENRALAVVVSETGTVHDKIIAVPSEFTPDQLEKFSRMLSERLEHRLLTEAIEILSREFQSEISQQRRFFEEVAGALRDELSETRKLTNIAVSGATKILMHPEFNDIEKARKMLSVFETKESLMKVFHAPANMEFSIKIGPENELEELQDSSFISSTYRIGDSSQGFFGIIGPTRMNYAKVLTALTSLSRCIEDIFKEQDDKKH